MIDGGFRRTELKDAPECFGFRRQCRVIVALCIKIAADGDVVIAFFLFGDNFFGEGFVFVAIVRGVEMDADDE